MHSQSSASIIRLFAYLSKQRTNIYLATGFSVCKKIFDIMPEILIGMAIDVVVSQSDSWIAKLGFIDPWQQILFLGVLTFIIWAGESVFHYLHMIYWRGLAQVAQHEIRLDAYRKVQQLDMHFFEDQNTGNLTSILNDDVNQLERFLDNGANDLIQTFTTVLCIGAVFYYLSPLIASIAFLPIPVIIAGAFYFQNKATPLYNRVREQVGSLNSRLNNNISGISTIKSFTAEKEEFNKLEQDSLSYLTQNKKAIAVSSAFIPILRMAILSGFLATFIIGAKQVFDGALNVGSYGVLVFLTQRLLWPMTGLATTVDLYERAMASTRRILNLIETPVTVTSGELKKEKLSGAIKFVEASFKYPSGATVFENLSFEIKPEKTTAIVGTTGSGKSTLVKLMLRFYDLYGGQILLDQEEIQNYDFHWLRKKIGLVSQDVFLFHGTIRENLAFANPQASHDEMIQCCQIAEAHGFIQELPGGYDTVIGERGIKISGGQRQRLSIARALLKNPDLLILDEATSAVDNETEAVIQRSLTKITKNRTTIIIAHRLSTVVAADHILVFDHGKIIEEGQHTDLMKSPVGVYRSLWEVQTGQTQAKNIS